MRLGKVTVTKGFLFLAALLLYRDRSGAVWQGFLACAVHELGHWAVLRGFGKPVRHIRVSVFGAGMEVGSGLSYGQEFCVAAAGPLANLTLARLTCFLPGLQLFAGVNLVLGIFNLLPVRQLDGARMLRSLLHLLCPEETAQRMSGGVDVLCSVIFVLLGLCAAAAAGNVTLCLVCLWLLKRPGAEKIWKFRKKERKRSCHAVVKRLK